MSFARFAFAVLATLPVMSQGAFSPDPRLWCNIVNKTDQDLTFTVMDKLQTVGNYHFKTTEGATTLSGIRGGRPTDAYQVKLPANSTSSIYFDTTASKFASKFEISGDDPDGGTLNGQVQFTKTFGILGRVTQSFSKSPSAKFRFSINKGNIMKKGMAWIVVSQH